MGKIKIGTVIDQEIWRTFRAECIRRGFTVARVLEDLIVSKLNKWSEPRKEKRS